jgi:hypothetical protein
MFTIEDTSLPRCHVALLWLQVPIFQRMIAPSFSGLSISRNINTVLLGLVTLKMKAVRFFKM